MKRHSLLVRILQYVIGIFVVTFGAVIIIRSSLGPAPYDVLFVHMKLTTPLTLGTSAFLVQGLIIFGITIARKNLKYLFSFGALLLGGAALDFWDLIGLVNYNPTSLWVRVASYPIGVYILTLGLALVSTTKIAAVSFDELMYLIMDVFHSKKVFWVRMSIEASGILLGLIVGLIGGIGFGELTIVSVLIVFAFPFLLQWQYNFLAKFGISR